MKNLVFVIFFFVSLGLFSDGTNWISYDGWVTGPGSAENKYTYLLPFGYFSNDTCSQTYIDEHPLLYETDMGWPVPNEDETQLKYMFFGDTYFFMRDEHHCVVSKITVGSDEDDNDDDDSDDNDRDFSLNFDIDEDVFDLYLGTDNDDDGVSDINYEQCDSHDAAEIERIYDFSPSAGINLKTICLSNCNNDELCQNLFCNNFNLPSYPDCFSACNNLDSNHYVFDYIDSGIGNQEEICKHFCMFDMVDTYASLGYFAFNEGCVPAANNDLLANYNKGTSNIFLAATLEQPSPSNNYQYNIKFQNTDETGNNSAQLYEITSRDPRKAKSVWMNNYERGFEGRVGIYTSGYFYACPGTPNEPCPQHSKKLFVPYNVTNWEILDEKTICKNANFNINNMENEFKHQKESLGVGIYDFENECRIRFSEGSDDLFPSCPPPVRPDGMECFRDDSYPNEYILWPLLSKMSNVTVIHGLERDILSSDDDYEAGYIYFMGIGETKVDTSLIDCIEPYFETQPKTQKIYIARVPAYESEIKCPASYEYFSGITNGISRWSKYMKDAKPLYGFYPLYLMAAESIVKHRDLYWMTARLNEATQKGAVVLASPDALHWQKVDTMLFQYPENINPESVSADYAFFWLPPKFIENGDNTMPFVYSILKSNTDSGKYTLSGFLDDDLNPKFTRYNLKSGKYKFMEKETTRAFLVNSDIYGNQLKNTILGNTPEGIAENNEHEHGVTNIGINPIIDIFHYNKGTISLPFRGFQNLSNLNFADSSDDRDSLRNRYSIIEYCYCGEQIDEEECMDYMDGNCSPYKDFIQTDESINDIGNWKIIDIVEDSFFDEHVGVCEGKHESDPDYMCNIPFEHGETLPKGIRSTPVWKWREQITKDLTQNSLIPSANVILRFSHWQDLTFEEPNYPEINRQLMENNKLVPYDCDGTGSSEIIATCQDPSSWRTTKMIHLNYRTPFYFPIIDSDKLRLEYLYPYPVMIHDYGKPGDPAPDIWDMLTADHFAREFFKVSSFEYADSSLRTLTSGAAATAVIRNGQMQIYAWGGTVSLVPRSTSLAGILYVGTYNPETEVVTFESEILDETDSNSPALTAGASMVYDDENDKIYLIGAVDRNGISRIYRLAEARTGRKWESVATIDLGRYFRLVKKSEHEYFAFGGQTGETSFNTKLYLLDLNNIASPQLLANIPTSGLANSFAAYSEMDQKLYVFGGLDGNGASDRFLSYDIKTNSWSSINASDGPGAGFGGVILVDYITETISLGGGVFVNNEDRQFKWIFKPKDMTWKKELKSGSYCLKESETALQGGIGTSGECVPFTHPWYSSFSAGATVYSLSGKGERLYVGTNNAIKVYDISDPLSPVLVSSFPTNSRVNDLEVYGDTLFAATNGGLYKLDASDPAELTQILFVSAFLNSQYKVEVYDGKLYVGDSSGIKVRDLETLSVLTSVNNGSVLDFAIENGEIGLYKDALFSPVEIRDAENLTLKANEFFGCFEIEVGSSFGRFYLSCDDETYRFEDDGDGGISFTELSGDIRELQDVYTYNGYTYFYDENTIWISTSSDVPALCGNGIVEGDEVCDGAPINCEDLDSNYVSGTATCNATCDGYNTNNCSDDGW